MSRPARSRPRFLGDTARTFVAFGLAMVALLVGSFGYGFAASVNSYPLAGPVYFTGIMLATFIGFFVIYQLITFAAWRRADPDQLRDWAAQTTPRTARERRIVLWTGTGARSWALTAALMALVAVLVTALVDELRSTPVIVALSLVTVASSWTMVVFAYALAYLRHDVAHGGLVFPTDTGSRKAGTGSGGGEGATAGPDVGGGAGRTWSDYFYLSVQVSTTFSSSDVEVTTTRMRRLTTGHTMIAFVFNTVIVALLVSVLLLSAT